jgi:2-polyprenyl-3-methyl-5-hydroxy-6-metoxy-1,4-benzoquinol methylase
MNEFSPSLNCECEHTYTQMACCYKAPPRGETSFNIKEEDYERSYMQCQICRHLFSSHNIDLSSLYSSSYVDSTYGSIEGMYGRFKAINSLPPEKSDNFHRIRRVEDYAKKENLEGKRLLDVGAGIGIFPSAMSKLGWDVTAIEPDSRTVEHLQKNIGIKAVDDDLLKLSSMQLGLFNIITLNKVLEHIENPVPLLRHSASMLADGGFIYIELPDIAAADESMYREEFFIEHHHIFSPASLSILAENSNLLVNRLERIREPSGKFTLCGYLKK